MNRQTSKQADKHQAEKQAGKQADVQADKQQTGGPMSKRTGGQTDPQHPDRASASDKVHGEGNYEASRRFNRDEKAFVESGKVEDAARKAAPDSAQAAREMEQAERTGKSRAKGQDRPDAMAKAPKDSGARE